MRNNVESTINDECEIEPEFKRLFIDSMGTFMYEIPPLELKVEVIFDKKYIGVSITEEVTFQDVSNRVGSIWGIPPSDIFFTDQLSDLSEIFLSHQKVYEELFTWSNINLCNESRLLYVVLMSNMSMDSFYHFHSPVMEEVDQYSKDPESLIEETKLDEDPALNEVKQRYNRNIAINLLQSLLLVGFTIMWIYAIISESHIFESSWVNDTLSRLLIGDPENMNSLSIYPYITIDDYGQVRNKWTFIQKATDLNNSFIAKTNVVDYPGQLTNFNYVYEAIEVRQLRSNLHWCEVDGYDSAVICLKTYGADPNTDDFGGETEAYTYDSEGSHTLLFGSIGAYDLGGFKAEYRFDNMSNWWTLDLSLNSDSWIDAQTRAVFYTMNLVNPSVGLISIVILMMEIGPQGSYAPNYKIASLYYNTGDGQFAAMHGILLFWVIILLLFEFRANQMSVDEIKFIENRMYSKLKENSPAQFEKEIRRHLKVWKKHDEKKWTQRFRWPKVLELISIVTLISVLVVGVANDIWFLTKISGLDLDEGKFMSIYEVLSANAIMNDFKLLIAIMLAALLCKSLVHWIGSLNEFVWMLRLAIPENYQLFFVTYGAVVTFCVVMFFNQGPYQLLSSNFNITFVRSLALIIGNMRIGSYFYMFNSHLDIFIFIVIFRLIYYVITLNIIVIIYFRLEHVRMDEKNKKEEEDKHHGYSQIPNKII